MMMNVGKEFPNFVMQDPWGRVFPKNPVIDEVLPGPVPLREQEDPRKMFVDSLV